MYIVFIKLKVLYFMLLLLLKHLRVRETSAGDEGREEILCYLLFACSCLCIPDVWREQGFLPQLTSGTLLTMSYRNESEQLLV